MVLSSSRRSSESRANPDSLIDPRSPPLPFTARTRTGRPVNGSGSSILELVLPPPKFVMRKSAPKRLERYRRRARGLSDRVSAATLSQRSLMWVTSVVLGIGKTTVLFKPFRGGVPLFGVARRECLRGEGAVDNFASFRQATNGSRCQQLNTDVAEDGRLAWAGQDELPG